MTSITSISQNELAQRRQKLRNQRRLRNLQSTWRIVAISSLAVGLAWVTTLPGWVIRKPEQIEIKGNKFLSTQTILSLLPLSYPQSLLKVQPQLLAEKLESNAPIATVTITRQLFPPRLTVQVKESRPVAITSVSFAASQFLAGELKKNNPNASGIGLLDEFGKWMPLESYKPQNESFKLPTLKVTGMQKEYTSYWPDLYRQLSRSPVKVFEVDWRDPANLILKTELGTVHLGSYSSKFADQLNAVDRMRKLPQYLKASQISYIDLKNPAFPAIQISKASNSVKPNTP